MQLTAVSVLCVLRCCAVVSKDSFKHTSAAMHSKKL